MSIPEPLLSGSVRQYTMGHLARIREGDNEPEGRTLLNLTLPTWQRSEVWDIRKKRRFIEGIYLGFDPGIYVVNGEEFEKGGKPRPFSGWLLDGQQRLTALRDYLQGELVIFDKVAFPELSLPDRRKFLNRPFSCRELDYCDDEDILLEIYDRLNYGGVTHEISAETAEFQAWKNRQTAQGENRL